MKKKLRLIGCSVVTLSLLTTMYVNATESIEPIAVENAEQPSADASAPAENDAAPADENPAEGTPAEDNVSGEDPNKYYVDYSYENMDELPEEVRATLRTKQEYESVLEYVFAPPARPQKEIFEYEDYYWKFVSYKQEKISEHKTLYKGLWQKVGKIVVNFVTEAPENLPEDLKEMTFDSIKVPQGDKIVTPKDVTLNKGDTVWTLTWPKDNIAGEENLTITGNWTSRPLTYEGTVTFVTRNGNQTVKFTNPDEAINHTDADGNKANENDSGGGLSKGYFLLWSTVPNYNGNNKDAKLFYGFEAISRAFPNGLLADNKLYSVDLTAFGVMGLARGMIGGITLNKDIAVLDTMYKKLTVKNDDANAPVYYVDDKVAELNLINLSASFEMNPYVTAAIRNHSGNWDYANMDVGAPENDDFIINPLNLNNLKEKIKDNQQGYTYVDLHVKLDQRLKLAENLEFSFKSYSFRPVVIVKSDYSDKLESEIVVRDNDPISKITLNTAGENEFIIRTRIRPKKSIPNATAEEAISDMQLISNSENNFSISKETITKIARGEEKPIEITGHIQGGLNIREAMGFGGKMDIPRVVARMKMLDFKPANVEFNLNAPFAADKNQDLGRVRVALNGNIDEDIFDMLTKPVVEDDSNNNIVGEAMPSNPEIEGYSFEGYNTMADGTGKTFAGYTKVLANMLNEEGILPVYAQWSSKVNFNKNSANYGDESEQEIKTVNVLYNKNLNDGILRGETIPQDPTLDGYVFKGWNTKADGMGEVLDLNNPVTEEITYYAIWEKKEPEVIPPENRPENPDDSEKPPVVDIIEPEKPPVVDELTPEIPQEEGSATNQEVRLPSTGQGSNIAALSLASIMALVGFGIFKKKKEEN